MMSSSGMKKMHVRHAYPLSNTSDKGLPSNFNEKEFSEMVTMLVCDLDKFGICCFDSFIGRLFRMDLTLAHSIRRDVTLLHQEGQLQAGQVIRGDGGVQRVEDIRGDLIAWLTGDEQGLQGVDMLIRLIDRLIFAAMQHPATAEIPGFDINLRTKAMAACYPGGRSHYMLHVDNPHGDGRVVTAIYYPNLNWKETDGGQLVIYNQQTQRQAVIVPRFDRLVFFWSDRRNPHEVRPALATRYAVTLWYLDGKQRNKYIQKIRNITAQRVQQQQQQQLHQEQSSALEIQRDPLMESSTDSIRTDLEQTPSVASSIDSIPSNNSLNDNDRSTVEDEESNNVSTTTEKSTKFSSSDYESMWQFRTNDQIAASIRSLQCDGQRRAELPSSLPSFATEPPSPPPGIEEDMARVGLVEQRRWCPTPTPTSAAADAAVAADHDSLLPATQGRVEAVPSAAGSLASFSSSSSSSFSSFTSSSFSPYSSSSRMDGDEVPMSTASSSSFSSSSAADSSLALPSEATSPVAEAATGAAPKRKVLKARGSGTGSTNTTNTSPVKPPENEDKTCYFY